MAIQVFRKNALAGAIGFALVIALISPIQAHANSSLRSEMNKMFGSMSNTTAPGVFETSRRGVIAGGSVVVRNKIMNTSIVSFQPPSFNAGCGGIDMFGGSFSFINKEQFVQLARSIASNAASYAFYLALDAMSPSVRSIIETIQKKIQELNQFFGNSCQLAQGIVNDTAEALDIKRNLKGATSKSFVGGFGDVFESFTSHGGSEPQKDIPPTEEHKIRGNIVWNALKNKGVAGWFTYGGDNLNSAIMTVTGTVIIGDPKPASDGKGTSSKITKIPSGLTTGAITFSNLVNGGKVSILNCGGEEKCLNLDTTSSTVAEVPGFAQMVKEMLTGGSSGNGIIQKIRLGTGLTVAEKNFLSALPNSMGAMIFKLSRVSEEVAKDFAHSAAEPIGREMAYELLKSFTDAAITAALAEQSNSDAQEAIKLLKESREEIYKQYSVMVADGAKLSDLMSRFNEMLRATAQNGITTDFIMPVTPSSSGS